MSYAEAIADFLHAMELEGIRPVDSIAQRLSCGELIRFRCEGDKPGRLNGWAILYLDERPAGAFGNYRMGVSRKWKVNADLPPMSQAERDALQEEWARAKQKKAEERAIARREAALDAQEMWRDAGPARADHGYVAAKGLDPAPLKQIGDILLIPMYDADGKLWNLQRIWADGTKRFLKGASPDGLFCLIGSDQLRDTICIGEGYATMSAVSRATGLPAIVAFNWKNLAPVSRIWAEHRPDLNYIVCADDDQALIEHPQIKKNLGLEAARAVALEIGGCLAVPLGRAA